MLLLLLKVVLYKVFIKWKTVFSFIALNGLKNKKPQLLDSD